jgi:transcription factor CRZ1
VPARGRSPSAGHHQQQPHIRNSHSPSPHPYPSPEPSIGLGLGLDNSAASVPHFNPSDFTNFSDNNGSNQFLDTTQAQVFPNQGVPDTSSFDATQDFTQSFAAQNLLAPDFNNSGDFSLFPSTSQADQFGAPLFSENPAISNPDLTSMTSPQTHHSPTPPHMLQPDAHQIGSAHQSPSFNQHQFSSSPHSRNVSASLAPGAAFLGAQQDWSQAQFQGHRRTPSEFSDVSSAHPSPSLIAHDTFEQSHSEHGHSPMQRPADSFDYGVSSGLNNFSISDGHLVQQGRSPSHSPAISPRILPQQLPDMGQPNPNFALGGQPQGYVSAPAIAYPTNNSEAFPTLSNENMPVMAPPSINIDFAPNSRQNSFEPSKPAIDQDSLTPPDRGMHRRTGRILQRC